MFNGHQQFEMKLRTLKTTLKYVTTPFLMDRMDEGLEDLWSLSMRPAVVGAGLAFDVAGLAFGVAP